MPRYCLAILIFLATSAAAYAQQGCCSHHGGVCNCACCDGTPLSDACRPYFPCGGNGGGTYEAPSSLAGFAASSTSCALSWKDNSLGEDVFQIEQKEIHQSAYILANTVNGNSTSATVDHLTPATTYSFRVRAHSAGNNSDYSNTTTLTTLPDPRTVCQAPAVCFDGSRFRVDAQFKTPTGTSGAANVVRLNDATGYLWFFDSTNVEVVFKILDACSYNHNFWFYAGGLTNMQVTITVTDTQSGKIKVYTNPQGKAFQPIQDSTAFMTCP